MKSARVGRNERADRLASTADITSGLQHGGAEVLRGLRSFLNMNRPELHSIDHLKERGVEKGSGWHSTLQGWERSVFNQTNIGTVSRATLGQLLRDGAEHVWAFLRAAMPSWAETETEHSSDLYKLKQVTANMYNGLSWDKWFWFLHLLLLLYNFSLLTNFCLFLLLLLLCFQTKTFRGHQTGHLCLCDRFVITQLVPFWFQVVVAFWSW